MATKRNPPMPVSSKDSKVSNTPGSFRRHIQMDPALPFSDAVLVGDTLYMSGRIGLDKSQSMVPKDIEVEACNVMEDVKSVLREAGMEMDDLVYVQVFCSDMSLWIVSTRSIALTSTEDSLQGHSLERENCFLMPTSKYRPSPSKGRSDRSGNFLAGFFYSGDTED